MVNAARRVVQVCSTGPREYRTRTREKAAQGPGLCLGGLPALSIAAYAISKGGKRVSNVLSCFASVLQTARFGGKPQYRPTRLQ